MHYLIIYLETFISLPFFLPLIFVFIFGLIIGSFLNVLVLRYDTAENLNGRSHCVKCQSVLTWYELIPLFSWLFLRGKCKKCRTKISIQYPLVELTTGALFVALYSYTLQSFSSAPRALVFFFWNAIIISILIAISVYDIRHKLIPNSWSYTFAVLALVQILWLTPVKEILGPLKNTESILNLLAGVIFFIPFYLLWKVSDGRWIGLGDGKLAIGIGWFLGFVDGISAIVLAFWIGAVVAILIMLIDRLNKGSKSITMKTEIPFGPFLILGTLIQFFWSIDVIGVSMFFM